MKLYRERVVAFSPKASQNKLASADRARDQVFFLFFFINDSLGSIYDFAKNNVNSHLEQIKGCFVGLKFSLVTAAGHFFFSSHC